MSEFKKHLKFLITQIFYALTDFLSLKVQFCVIWMVFIVLSKFNVIVTIVAAVFGILALYMREIQKPNSNFAEILKVWLSNRQNGKSAD